ncbi:MULTISPECIES: hypothetical protein [unclassified Nocardioides]|uniref:hypothetical protein n=1 Tax=unclassified Nocardioides TaxID=2615069 RepID=UPI000715B7AA|nr:MULTISPECIES: hypothetical protein [unclassified Nocardioides]KRC71280.1 hypothetical protein ASE20_10055 [Nocardioides sp. Root240]
MKSQGALLALLTGGAVVAVAATATVALVVLDDDDGPTRKTDSPKTERLVLADAYEACDHGDGADRLSLADGGHSIIVSAPDDQPIDALACVLNELGTSEAIVAQMETTTSMMGRQSANQDGIGYEWSYHPDNGMNMTIADE